MNNAMLLYAHLTDKELADKVKQGAKGCFEVLVRRHAQALSRVARMYSFSESESEDLVYCSLAEAYRMLDAYRQQFSFRAWLTKIMVENCMTAKRERATQHEESLEPACASARVAHHSERLTLSQTIGKAESCLDQLPPPLRSVYLLHEIDGYGVPEIAFLLNTSEEFVRLRLEKANLSLRKSLRRWYKLTEIYPLDQHSCERIVYGVMKALDEATDVPVGAP